LGTTVREDQDGNGLAEGAHHQIERVSKGFWGQKAKAWLRRLERQAYHFMQQAGHLAWFSFLESKSDWTRLGGKQATLLQKAAYANGAQSQFKTLTRVCC
jgi:hypothetical protein